MVAETNLTIRRQVTTGRLQRDLRRIVDGPDATRERLPAVPAPAPLTGLGSATPPTTTTTTAGIASPLTEPDYAAREYHPEVVLTSSDGVFTIEVQPLAAVELTDANAAPVRIEYAAPPAP